MVIGGVIAVIKKTSGNFRSLVLHFAAGVVFSVVAVELLPDIMKQHSPLQIIIGFISGFVLMILIRKVTEPKLNADLVITNKNLPLGFLIAVGIDIFIDGILLGIGFFAGNTEGILLAVALSLELFSLGIATAMELRNKETGKSKSLKIIIGLALVFLVSAILGATLLHNLSHAAKEVMLSFGLSALLFLVTEELLTEAHKEKETVWHTSAFFVGFLLFLILGIIM